MTEPTHTAAAATPRVLTLPGRRPWFDVQAVRAPHGTWSIMLRIDGQYTSEQDAKRMAAFWREQLGLGEHQ